MADNLNPQAVKFVNERVRPLADALARAYYLAEATRDEWYANNLGTIFPFEDTVQDGSATDGRHPLTGSDVVLLINRAEELIADYAASSNAKLNTILKPAVNARG